MKKLFFLTFIALSINILYACNAKPGEESKKSNDLTEDTQKNDAQSNASQSSLSFIFKGINFNQDKNQTDESAGMRTTGNNWLLGLYGLSTDQEQQAGLQFNIENFNLQTGVVTVKICTLSLNGFEDEEMDSQLYSTDDFTLEITAVKKVKSEAAMGTAINNYSISGTFKGSFRTITGDKFFKLENGRFENHIVTEIVKE